VELQFVIIVLLVSFGLPFTLFPYCSALLFYLNISPVPTCLVHNCETSRSFVISICCHSCLEIKFPLIPINARLVHSVDNPEYILQKKARFVANRRQASMGITSKMSELSEWPTPSLRSPSNVELNPVREPNSMPELSQLLFVQHLTKRTQ